MVAGDLRSIQSAKAFSLLRETFLTIFCEALDPGEDGIRIEMCFGDHVRFQAAGEPLIVPVRGKGIPVGEWSDIADGPHAARARTDHHKIVICFWR